jgi:hypothetical protein
MRKEDQDEDEDGDEDGDREGDGGAAQPWPALPWPLEGCQDHRSFDLSCAYRDRACAGAPCWCWGYQNIRNVPEAARRLAKLLGWL